MHRVERIDTGDYDGARFINTVLTMYYVDELRQTEIAQRLGLSTAKVNRLLQQARRQGLVEISIRTPFQHLFGLESRLKAIFGLKEAMVIPPVTESANAIVHTLGRAGANFLLEHLRDGDVISMGSGVAIHAVAQALEAPRTYDVKVVPMLGAVQGQLTADVNYLVSLFAERLGGKAYQLHAPAFVDTREHRAMLLSMRPVKEILDIARCANIALTGIGVVKSETSRFVQSTALSPEDMRRIVESYGGVGDIGAYIFDIEGRPCAQEYADRVVGLTLEELKRIPFRIGIAATAAKALPIYGALRGGYLQALITDETAAQGVIELFEQDFHGQSH